MSNVLVYALHYEGQINKNSLGAVSEGARLASELGGECHAIVVGDKAGLGDDVLAPLAAELGFSLERTAHGMLGVVAANMVRAIRTISVERGHDPRRFALMPFGGAGPLHARDVARALGMRVLGPSAITNAAAGTTHTVSHDEVLQAGRAVADDLQRLVRGVLRRL